MRAEPIIAAAGLVVVAGVLTGCGAEASTSVVTVTPDGSDAQQVTVGEVDCLTSPDKFTASSSDQTGDLPQFLASVTESTDRSTTWVHLEGDTWFMTTEAFGHDDGSVTFDNADGRIGAGADGAYPTDLDQTATIDGTVSCTSKKEL